MSNDSDLAAMSTGRIVNELKPNVMIQLAFDDYLVQMWEENGSPFMRKGPALP